MRLEARSALFCLAILAASHDSVVAGVLHASSAAYANWVASNDPNLPPGNYHESYGERSADSAVSGSFFRPVDGAHSAASSLSTTILDPVSSTLALRSSATSSSSWGQANARADAGWEDTVSIWSPYGSAKFTAVQITFRVEGDIYFEKGQDLAGFGGDLLLGTSNGNFTMQFSSGSGFPDESFASEGWDYSAFTLLAPGHEYFFGVASILIPFSQFSLEAGGQRTANWRVLQEVNSRAFGGAGLTFDFSHTGTVTSAVILGGDALDAQLTFGSGLNPLTSVPEPASYIPLSLGLVTLLGYLVKRR